jgi:diguanylate cyclase (GGDEF)-like protein
VGRILKEKLHRPGDFIARYGGDEFVILMPNTDTKGALQVAQSIQRAIINSNIDLDKGSPKRTITASIGVAVSIPTEIESSADLLNAADQALYDAKAKGRNRVVLFKGATTVNSR